MKTIVVTPAGRERYMRLLVRHIAAQKQDFDEWHLWVNTNVQSDIAYMEDLARQYEWIRLIRLPLAITKVDSYNIHRFFEFAKDPDAIYIRFDDDIVYIAPNCIHNLAKFRRENPTPFLVYGNIVNNAIISHLHQRNGLVCYHDNVGYDCMDITGWKDPAFCLALHNAFIADVEGNNLSKWLATFESWICSQYERVSINCVSWFGRDMTVPVGSDEEQWLSVERPRALKRCNVIYGKALCAHFAFFTQRSLLDNGNVLQRYEALCP